MYHQSLTMDSKRKKEISILSAFAAGALASPKPSDIKNFEEQIHQNLSEPSKGFRRAQNAVKVAVLNAIRAQNHGGGSFLHLVSKETDKLLTARAKASGRLAAQALRWAIINRAPLSRKRS